MARSKNKARQRRGAEPVSSSADAVTHQPKGTAAEALKAGLVAAPTNSEPAPIPQATVTAAPPARTARSNANGEAPSFLTSIGITQSRIAPLLLLLVSIATRFWKISEPGSVVFDEYHFGKFIDWYFTGEYFFDIHPPLGKLTFVLVGWLGGYDHSKCEYEQIHQVYGPGCSFLLLRCTAAVFGCLLPPLVYYIALEFGASSSGGTLAGCLIIFDMLNLIESRLILTDSQLMFYCALALYVALRMWKRLNAVHDDANRARGKRSTIRKWTLAEENRWCLALGMACGAAVSIKWTALATPGLIAVECVLGLFFLKSSVSIQMLLKIAGVVITQYTLWFWIHFQLLPYSGSGDAFMPIEFQRTLVNNTYYNPAAPQVSFFWIYPELNREMLSANARIDVVHAWATRWTQWVYNERGVLYWTGRGEKGTHKQVYLMGNPIVLWICLLGVAAFIVTGLLYLRMRRSQQQRIVKTLEDNQPGAVANTISVCSYCLTAYFLNLLPYIAVARSAFIYHYMPGLMYAEILLAMWIDRVTRPYHVTGTRIVLLAIFLGFVYWCPWVYALELSAGGHKARRWLPKWN